MIHGSRRPALFAAKYAAAFIAVVALAACSGDGLTPPSQAKTVSISAPQSGQTLSGTVAVAAAGVGGDATDIEFELAGHTVTAQADGTATFNTRSLSDGNHTLKATAVVANQPVSHSIAVVVDNDLPSSGTVGTAGGSLKSPAGSYASVLPGALGEGATVSIDDLSKEAILAEYGVDYEALGVTFLGALDVESSVDDFALPVQVDLAGWAQAVQPGQQVVMFALSTDLDGDGVGELMAVADAQATVDGSVITRPQPRSELYGPTGSTSGLGAQQATSARPGQVVTLSGRGYVAGGVLSTTARFGSGTEVLVHVANAEVAPFNPRQTLELVMPALPMGSASLRLDNHGTGYVSPAMTVTVGSLGSGSAATWSALVDQLQAALDGLTAGRPDAADLAASRLANLRQASNSMAAAMAQNSSLVSAANLASLASIGAGTYSASQRKLVRHHALLLDAIATSAPEVGAAADLARLMLLLDPSTATAAAALSAANLGPQQSEISVGDPCAATGASSSGATGMGAAPPPGGSACGAGGGGGGGPTSANGASVGPQQAVGFGPVEGAIVRILRPGTNDKLSPFTSLTDANGYYRVPFVPEGEPFTVQAIDPATGAVATAHGVGPKTGEGTSIPLVFALQSAGPGAPTASFTISPAPGGTVAGTWNYEFDASASSDPDGEIVEYLWSFAGVSVVGGDYYTTIEKGFGRNGTYTVNLTVIDDDGQIGVASRQLEVTDLPYDYWTGPPELVTVAQDGQLPDKEIDWGYAADFDGRYLAFTTEAGNLHPDDDNGLNDAFLKDMETGAIVLLSRALAGMEVRDRIAVSATGRFVAFSEAVDQPTGAGPTVLFVRDLQDGISQEIPMPDGFTRHYPQAISSDGSRLLFNAYNQTGAESGVYVFDGEEDESIRLGLRLDGLSYARIYTTDMSDDGRYVAFYSSAPDLVENDTNEAEDAFLYDLESAETLLVSVTQDGEFGNDDTWPGTISADGRFVTLWTDATNLGGVSNGFEHLYVKDTLTGALDLISANAAGVEGDWDSVLPVISNDGRFVAFGSYADNLVPLEDSRDDGWAGRGYNGMSYVKDRQTGRIAMVTMGLDSAYPNDWDQIEPIISGNGRYVYFYSWATNLVPRVMPGDLHYYRVENPFWEP